MGCKDSYSLQLVVVGARLLIFSKQLLELIEALAPKEGGGHGIIDLKTQNSVLLLKHLDKFYNSADLPWVRLITWSKFYGNTQTPPHARSPVESFWWKDVLKLFEKFRNFSICIPNKGNSVMLWADNWSGSILKKLLPSFAFFL